MATPLVRRIAVGLAGVGAAIVLVGAVLLAHVAVPGAAPSEVRVTEVDWSAVVTNNASANPPQCVVGLPASTPGALAPPSGWIIAGLNVSVDPAYRSSCYFFGASVQPSGFEYVNVPGAWGPLTPGYHLALNISVPSAAFGPGPIHITLYTSTTPGCAYCP